MIIILKNNKRFHTKKIPIPIAYCIRIKLNKTREALAACHYCYTGKLSSSSSSPCPCFCPCPCLSPGCHHILIFAYNKHFTIFHFYFKTSAHFFQGTSLHFFLFSLHNFSSQYLFKWLLANYFKRTGK